MCFKEGEVYIGFFVGDLDGTLGRNSVLMVLIVLLKEKGNRSRKNIPCVRCVTKEELRRIPCCSGNNPYFLNPLANVLLLIPALPRSHPHFQVLSFQHFSVTF